MWQRFTSKLAVAAIVLTSSTAVRAQSPADFSGGPLPVKPKASLAPESAPATGLPPVSKETVRKDIEAFRRDPTHLIAADTRVNIMRFAQDSPDVRVVIGPKPVPWLENKSIAEDVRTGLLTAYLAGNVQSQLDHGKPVNDSVAGVEQVIATYRQLQQAKPGLAVPEVEKLIEIQKQGRLTDYLADAETAISAEK